MADEKLRKLIDRLLVKTLAGELEWFEIPSQETFQVSFPSYSVEVERSDETTFLRVYNSDGKVLDWISDALMIRDSKYGSDDIRKFDELFQLVRRQVLGVDKALEELLAVIG